MKKAIFYYSVTGNSKKLTETIKISYSDYDILNINDITVKELSSYDLVGFLCPVYYLNINPVFKDFLNKLTLVNNKKAFVIVAYSVMWGRAIKNIADILTSKGFDIIGYEKILTSETFPPYRKRGILNNNYPEASEVSKLLNFIGSVENKPTCKVKLGFWDLIILPPKDKKIKKDFGELIIDHSKCTQCGECITSCQFNAIKLEKQIIQTPEKCKWCYTCYNTCKEKAISTSKISSEFSIA